MHPTLTARGLRAGHGTRLLFENVELDLSPGEVIGLIGPNGCGKSTLLAIVSGRSMPESGTVTLAPAAATCGYLPQEPDPRPDEDVLAYLARYTGVAKAVADFAAAADGLAAGTAQANAFYDTALAAYLASGAPDFDARALEVTAQIGLDLPLKQPMASLSGGQAARVGLAALLLGRHDFLALDEPTNNLDLAGLGQLEHFLGHTRAGVIVVSHDREFLARTVTSVLDFDPVLAGTRRYAGGYESYRAERERARSAAALQHDQYLQERAQLVARAAAARATADRGARTAQRAFAAGRVDKLTRDRMVDGASAGAAAAGRAERALQRLSAAPEPRRQWQLRMLLAPAPASGEVVATLNAAAVTLGSFRLGPVDLQLARGDRVVITGANGSGKSTLLRLITGRLAPDSGRAHLGAGVRLGEVDQARAACSGPPSAVEVLGAAMPGTEPGELRTLLAKYGLAGSAALRPGWSLSAGERTRVALAVLAAAGVNLLVLDEPTNHLDLPAIEQLEGALANYPGTLLLVSHDRRLLSAVRATRWLTVRAGQVIPGNDPPAAGR